MSRDESVGEWLQGELAKLKPRSVSVETLEQLIAEMRGRIPLALRRPDERDFCMFVPVEDMYRWIAQLEALTRQETK